MIASQFPRTYRAYCFDDKKMYYADALIKLGMTLSPDGLPAFSKEPHFSVCLMWFSGQLDKNQKEIYEGDICKVHLKNEYGSLTVDYAIMRWHAPAKQFILQMPSPFGNQLLEVAEVELLGNEFENTELVPLISAPAN